MVPRVEISTPFQVTSPVNPAAGWTAAERGAD